MKRPIGISSSCGDWTVAELIDICKQHELDCVDLRVGRGQRWELAGPDQILSLGIGITFFGSDIVIGDPNSSMSGRALELAVSYNVAIRVFLAHKANAALVDAHIDVLTKALGGAELIWLETHRGYAEPDALAHLCARSSCGIILDNYGLFQISKDCRREADRVAPFVKALQVKGFWDTINVKQPHLGLDNLSGVQNNILRGDFGVCPMILESKANTLEQDFEFFRRLAKLERE